MKVYHREILSTDPRLKRHVHHDSRSWNYEYIPSGTTLKSIEWNRTLGILDQGQVGSCTAEAGFGLMGTEPYYSINLSAQIAARFGSFDQTGAYKLYSSEETLDGNGQYPPSDYGSSGLTCAKVLRNVGLISGWKQTFSLDAALQALMDTPFITGTNWYNSMFEPDANGVLTVDRSSGVAGGHEYEVVGYDFLRGLVKFANSWGTSWGDNGYFYLHAEDYGALLDEQGDTTIFVPSTSPAPVPTDPNSVLAATAKPWVNQHHIGANARMAKALKVWLKAEGR